MGPERYNRGLYSVSLAGWPWRVSQRWRDFRGTLSRPPKDKSWSSFDSPAAAPRSPSVLQHRRCRQAHPPRRPLHRAPGFLQPDRQGQRGKHPHRPGPPDVLARRRRASLADRRAPDQAGDDRGRLRLPRDRRPAAASRCMADAGLARGRHRSRAHRRRLGRQGLVQGPAPQRLARGAFFFQALVPAAAPRERGDQDLSGTVLLRVREAKEHSDTIVASAHEVDDRTAAEALQGARIFIPRSSFPTASTDEYYWVDLIGLRWSIAKAWRWARSRNCSPPARKRAGARVRRRRQGDGAHDSLRFRLCRRRSTCPASASRSTGRPDY